MCSRSLEVKLVPSRINFTSCLEARASQDEAVMGEFCKKVVERGEYPRLQVAEKDGAFFALNNTRLHLFRRLEKLGHCKRVIVEQIALRDIPEAIQQMMTVSPSMKNPHQGHGYECVCEDEDGVRRQADCSDSSTDTEHTDTSDTDYSEDNSSADMSSYEEEDESLL